MPANIHMCACIFNSPKLLLSISKFLDFLKNINADFDIVLAMEALLKIVRTVGNGIAFGRFLDC